MLCGFDGRGVHSWLEFLCFSPPSSAHADPLLLAPAMAEAKATRVALTTSLLAPMLRTASSDTEMFLADLHVRRLDSRTLLPWKIDHDEASKLRSSIFIHGHNSRGQ